MTCDESDIRDLMDRGCTREIAINAITRFKGDKLRALMWIRDNGLYVDEAGIKLVMVQAACSWTAAARALEEADGDLARAIMHMRVSRDPARAPDDSSD